MPPIDHTPPLDLASSSVRAKLSVVNPRLPDGSRVPSVTWSTDDETELPLEAAPDAIAQIPDPAWVDPGDGSTAPLIDWLDPDGTPNKVFSVYANTPLTPDPGTKADGTVTCSAPGMASIDKLVRYGDAALGHFTLVATEAPEA